MTHLTTEQLQTIQATVDSLLDAIIAIAAKEVGFTDSCDYVCLRGEKVSIKNVDCPQLDGQEGEDIVDLWFELVDAGYTEDEAFELIEMVMESDLGVTRGDSSISSYERARTETPSIPGQQPEGPHEK